MFCFIQATEKNQVAIINYLVNIVKVNVNKLDPYGRSAKDIARYFGFNEIIEILDNSNVDVEDNNHILHNNNEIIQS